MNAGKIMQTKAPYRAVRQKKGKGRTEKTDAVRTKKPNQRTAKGEWE